MRDVNIVMIEVDLIGILMLALLGGGIVTFIGAIIKFFNAGDILNFYDDEKHDKEKVSKLVGNDLFYTGLGVIFIAVLGILLSSKYYPHIILTQVSILVAGCLLSCYHLFWTCKK